MKRVSILGNAPRKSFSSSKKPFRSGTNSLNSIGKRKTFGARPNGPFRGGNRGKGRKEQIDFSKFIYKPAAITEQKKYDAVHTFDSLGLSKEIVKNLLGRGIKTPTEIQDKIIPAGLKGQDVIGLSHTGSGKTAAFLLPLIEKLHKDKKQKVIILAPTRELAQQINKELRECSHGMYLYSTVCVGGSPIYRQIQDLKRPQHFVIGTPGRLKDLEDRGVLHFEEFSSIVLDEVDRMLDMGFVDDITKILKKLPEQKQAFFFSATMPPKIKILAEKFLKNPKMIDLGQGVSTKNVYQDVVRTKTKEEKFDMLMDLLNVKDVQKSIVFVETKREVDELTKKLTSYKYKVGLLHGDRRQRERERTLSQFRDGMLNVLVATDVAARGIDVKEVSQVINYTIPQTHDDYVHRIGRTGRAGAFGKAFTFI